MSIFTNSKIIVALDVCNYKAAISLAQKLDPRLCRLKVGMELFTAAGPKVVEYLKKIGFDIFLDLKFHDIPNTVAGAVRSAANLNVWMINVHCLGGRKMMESAANAVANMQNRPLLIGVTILTSLNEKDMHEIGVEVPLKYYMVNKQSKTEHSPVIRLTKLARQSGLDGVVCSGQEVNSIRNFTNYSFILVTPGIRLPDGNQDDQARIVTPEVAIKSGASYLVVGRPITGAADPIAALHEFNKRVALAK